MERQYAYEKMLAIFNKIGYSLEKLPLTEEEKLDIIKSLVYNPKQEKEEFKQNKDHKKIMEAISEYGKLFDKDDEETEKIDAIESNTECVIPVEQGMEFEVINQISKYCKDRMIDICNIEKPEVVNGRIKIKTTSENAKGISDYLQSDELLGQVGQKSHVVEEDNQWIINAPDVKGVSKVGINPSGLYAEDLAEQSSELIKEYIDDMTKNKEQNKDAAGFSLDGFEKYLESKNKESTKENDAKIEKDIEPKAIDKNKIKDKGNTDKDNPKSELNKAVLENVKTKKEEFQQTAFERYKQLITNIIRNGQSVSPGDYNWALEQFKNTKYTFSEINQENVPTNFAVKGKLLAGGDEFEIATYDFKNPEMKEVRRDDMKDVISENALRNDRTFKGDGPSPVRMHEINKNPTELCHNIQGMLGQNEIGHEHSFDGEKNGTQMFRKILYMLRENNQSKTQEQTNMQQQSGQETTRQGI